MQAGLSLIGLVQIMKYQYLRAFIVLLAGLITLIVNIKTHKNIIVSLLILLGVIIVFYVIATLCVEILQRSMNQKENEQENQEELEKTDIDEEEEKTSQADYNISDNFFEDDE